MNPHNSIEETQSVQKEVREELERIMLTEQEGQSAMFNVPQLEGVIDRIFASIREETRKQDMEIVKELIEKNAWMIGEHHSQDCCDYWIKQHNPRVLSEILSALQKLSD